MHAQRVGVGRLVGTLVVLAMLLLLWGPVTDLIGAARRRGRPEPRPAE